MPFASAYQRDIHFKKHGHQFHAANAIEYAEMADRFMFTMMTLTMQECTQANLVNRLRYNMSNRHFGVALAGPPEFVKTFYQVPLHTVHHFGGHAGLFTHECAKTDL
jgi:hypothetical protein